LISGRNMLAVSKANEIHKEERTSVYARVTSDATRFMLESSLPSEYIVEYAPSDEHVVAAVKRDAFDVYVIDTAGLDGEMKTRLIIEIGALRLKHPIRILALLDGYPLKNSNRMEVFGPLFFLEVFATKQRMKRTLEALTSKKIFKRGSDAGRDTGCRVKKDDKFFNTAGFMEQQ